MPGALREGWSPSKLSDSIDKFENQILNIKKIPCDLENLSHSPNRNESEKK
jgi:hypothetical protein